MSSLSLSRRTSGGQAEFGRGAKICQGGQTSGSISKCRLQRREEVVPPSTSVRAHLTAALLLGKGQRGLDWGAEDSRSEQGGRNHGRRCRQGHPCRHCLRALRFVPPLQPLGFSIAPATLDFNEVSISVCLENPFGSVSSRNHSLHSSPDLIFRGCSSPGQPTLTSTGQAVTDEQLSMLHFILDKNLERALRILDQGGVHRVVSQPSERSVFQVIGESKTGPNSYLCFPEHFCSCQSFFFDVISRSDQLCCKHQLAAMLANALHRCRDVTVSDAELAHLLLQC